MKIELDLPPDHGRPTPVTSPVNPSGPPPRPSWSPQTLAPSLWNPNASANWCLIFSPAFGAFLHARNWEALGDPSRARASRVWFWVCLAWLMVLPFLAVFLPESPLGVLMRLSGLGLLLGWYFSLGRPQAREVKARFGNDYVRRSWGAPLGLALAGLLTYIVYSAGIGVVGALTGAGLHQVPRAREAYTPLEAESPETAGRPLAEVLEALDTGKDPKAASTFMHVLQNRLLREQFQDLDTYAGFLRDTKARNPDGGWKLYRLVSALKACPGSGDPSAADWKAHLDRLTAWQKAMPESITAPIVLGGGMVSWAWDARGDGFANTVSPAAWRVFHARLDQARRVLEGAPESVRRCPMWFATMHSVALGQGWGQYEYDQLYDRAVAQEPSFLGHYANKATYLLPRWHGQPGDWERFATEAADRVGGDDGDVIYFWIVRTKMVEVSAGEMRDDRLIDWLREKRGFRLIEARHGLDRWTLNMQCRMMAVSNDRMAALPLLDRIGDDWDPAVWKGTNAYSDFRDWARREGKFRGAP